MIPPKPTRAPTDRTTLPLPRLVEPRDAPLPRDERPPVRKAPPVPLRRLS